MVVVSFCVFDFGAIKMLEKLSTKWSFRKNLNSQTKVNWKFHPTTVLKAWMWKKRLKVGIAQVGR